MPNRPAALASIQNLWRPLHLGRFNTAGRPETTATLLSIESQAKSLSAAGLAPLLGLAVDAMQGWVRPAGGAQSPVSFLPVALVGMAFAAGVLVRLRPQAATGGPAERGV